MSAVMRKVLLAGVAAGIAAVTLVPSGALDSAPAQSHFQGARTLVEAVANILLFVPLGVAAALTLRRWIAALAAGILFSAVIELVQLGIGGRYGTPWDLLFNSAGAAAGVALARRAEIARLPAVVRHRMLSTTLLLGALLLLIGGAALFHPDVPPDLLYGRWAAASDTAGATDARVVHATVGSMTVRAQAIGNSAGLRRLLIDGAPISVEMVAGRPRSGLAPVFRIIDQHRREALMVGVDGRDLVFRYRSRATALGLGQPEIRAHGALATVAAGDSVTLRIWRQRDGTCVAADRYQQCGLGFGLADTWSLLLRTRSPRAAALLSITWLATLLFPAGLWTSRRDLVIAIALTLTVLVTAPFALRSLPTSPPQLLAAAAGLTLGHILGQRRRRRAAAVRR